MPLKPLDTSDNASWKAYFRVSSITSSQLASRNPERGIVTSNRDGVYQQYAWHLPTNNLMQVTDFPTGKHTGYISADGERIYYLHDEMGDNIGHYHFTQIITGETHDISPDMPAYASFYFTECYTGNYYGFMTANQYGFMMFVIDNHKGGDPIFRYETGALSAGPFLSYDAEIAVIATTERSQSTDYILEAYDTKTGEKLHELWDGEGTSVEPIGFAKRDGDMRFLGHSNRTGNERPFYWNTRTGERVDLPIDAIEGSVEARDWTPDGRYILLRQMHNAQQQMWLYDTQSKETKRLKHPEGTYMGMYFSPSGTIYAHLQHGATPTHLVELGGRTGEYKQTILEAGEAPQGRTWQSVTYKSEDGTPIQAWLMLPDDAEFSAPYPTIVHTHGGPSSVQLNGYDANAQTWTAHGFAVMSINYRGSTTFGRDFKNAINGQLGTLEIQDIDAGVQYLLDEGIAREDAIFKTGWSYGGYLTLLSLGRLAHRFRGGMAGAAIADWSLLYEDEAETLRGYQRSLFGGSPEEKPEAHRTSSPSSYVQQIEAPMLIIQGRNDSTCPERQMEVYIDKLESLGKRVDVHWYDAGHAVGVTDMQIEHMQRMLTWVYGILGEEIK
jgi:dipeptidyl aminopeptidase/acylaminoacyl peptidase